jgi:transcriptional regulator with XRE-family HTH domain
LSTSGTTHECTAVERPIAVSEINNRISTILRTLRTRPGFNLSERELAKRAGVSRERIRSLEAGRFPFHDLNLVSAIYGVDPVFLLALGLLVNEAPTSGLILYSLEKWTNLSVSLRTPADILNFAQSNGPA